MSHTQVVTDAMQYIMDNWHHSEVIRRKISAAEYCEMCMKVQWDLIRAEFGLSFLLVFVNAVAQHKERLWNIPGVSW